MFLGRSNVFRGTGKIGYLTGNKNASVKKDPSYTTWDAEISTVITWLVHAMNEEISVNYICYLTTKEL